LALSEGLEAPLCGDEQPPGCSAAINYAAGLGFRPTGLAGSLGEGSGLLLPPALTSSASPSSSHPQTQEGLSGLPSPRAMPVALSSSSPLRKPRLREAVTHSTGLSFPLENTDNPSHRHLASTRYRYMFLFFVVLGMEPGAWYMVGKHPATEPYPSPRLTNVIWYHHHLCEGSLRPLWLPGDTQMYRGCGCKCAPQHFPSF
jgi:hypothetical protein